MEIHHFSWENPLFLWQFSIAFCMFTRPGISLYLYKYVHVHVLMWIPNYPNTSPQHCQHYIAGFQPFGGHSWWWSRWASWKPRKLIKPTTETSEILPDPVGFLPFLPSFGKAQSCEVVLMILMLGHWSRLKITKVRTMTLQNIGARQAVDPFTNQGLWGFPKSWGYPQSSSILDWGFPL